MSEVIEEYTNESALEIVNLFPNEQQHLEIKGKYLDEAEKAAHFSLGFFEYLSKLLRNNLYLPYYDHIYHGQPIDSFSENSGVYAAEFVRMVKGEHCHLDPTFPCLSQMIGKFHIEDVPVKVEVSNKTYTFQTRVIQSKEQVNGKHLCLILFSFYDHFDDQKNGWDPLTINELSSAPLEVLRAYQTQLRVDSMMLFSLGSLIIDAFKNLSQKDMCSIPKTIILNRGLSSISKVVNKGFPFPFSYCLYQLAYYLGLDANPERTLINMFAEMRHHSPKDLSGRKVVIIKTVHDYYFSGEGDFNPNFEEKLRSMGIDTYTGNFFMPITDPQAHHAIRLDWLCNTKVGSDTSEFFPMDENESLSSGLLKGLMRDTDDTHTMYIAGGNRDNLNTITYLQAVPLMTQFIQGSFNH